MNKSWGDYYGYPKCCVQSFQSLLIKEILFSEISNERKQVSSNGFVPCQKCAERILKGEVTIEQLILPSRQAKPFKKDVF